MDGAYEFSNGIKVTILAYADDICIVRKCKGDVEEMLKKLHDYTQWAGLNFNPAKCVCLSMVNHSSRKYVDNFRPLLC